jgi:pimeloyl-ACP methyl ester carboxylesterase
MLDALRPEPLTATARLADVLGAAMGGGDAMVFLAGPGDEPLLADPAVRGRVEGMLDTALAQGALGCATDIVSDQIATWDFDPRSIGAPVHLVYSEDDVVAPHHGDWWEERLVDVTRHTAGGVGHLLVIPMWAAILDAVVG